MRWVIARWINPCRVPQILSDDVLSFWVMEASGLLSQRVPKRSDLPNAGRAVRSGTEESDTWLLTGLRRLKIVSVRTCSLPSCRAPQF